MAPISFAEMLSTMGLFGAAGLLTWMSFWAGGRLTPWFLSEAIEAPSVSTLFFSGEPDSDFYRVRVAACGLSFAVMLASLLAIVIAARMMGWHLAA
ncbi:MAG TPA: hypothetical protein VG942_16875 [Hyphomonadaceae bacterium]|nr:hypothetical protein [Hyphomonadaceae bacterium]